MSVRTLSHAEARKVYDRIGRAQDTQAFYEDRATADLIRHLDLPSAQSLFELGCGTGRFAAEVLSNHLPATAVYRAVDVSPVMAKLASERLAAFGSRATVRLTDGQPPTDEPSESCDRFVSNFVLDLLSDDEIAATIAEAHRMLVPGGLLGVCGLAPGFTVFTRVVAGLWSRLHALSAALVGGCRPVDVLTYLPPNAWRLRHHARLAPFGLPLASIVAERVGCAAA